MEKGEKSEYQSNGHKGAAVHPCVRFDSRQIDKCSASLNLGAISSTFHYQLDKLSKIIASYVISIYFTCAH